MNYHITIHNLKTLEENCKISFIFIFITQYIQVFFLLKNFSFKVFSWLLNKIFKAAPASVLHFYKQENELPMCRILRVPARQACSLSQSIPPPVHLTYPKTLLMADKRFL